MSNVSSADEKINLFESKYREIYDTNFPKKKKTSKRRKTHKSWIVILPWPVIGKINFIKQTSKFLPLET